MWLIYPIETVDPDNIVGFNSILSTFENRFNEF